MLAIILCLAGSDGLYAKKKKDRCDLIVRSLSAPSSADSSSKIRIISRVKNKGKIKAKGSYTRFYLSKNKTVGKSDYYLGKAKVPSLKKKKSSKKKKSYLKISSDIPAGTYYLIAMADGTKKNKEKSEKNNYRKRRITINKGETSETNTVPTGISAIEGNGQINISWTGVAVAASYNIYMASESGVAPHNFNSLDDGMKHFDVTSPFINSGLTNGKTYYFTVTAVTADGESLPSAEVSAVPAMNLPKILHMVSAGEAQPGAKFGIAVDIDGDYAIIGANGEGAAYIFRRTGPNTWDNGTKVVSPDALKTSGGFASYVAIRGDYAIVGDPQNDDGGTVYHIENAGAAYIFRRTGLNSWDAGTKIGAPDALSRGSYRHFGTAVDTNGDYAIVGTASFLPSAAYIFHRTGTNAWDSGTKILPSDGKQAFDGFSQSVAIDGDYAIVGAAGRDGGSGDVETDDTGAAYIYKRTGNNTWSGTKLKTPDAEPGNLFGDTVAIDGKYAIVGSIGNSAAYIFRRIDINTWNDGTRIMAPSAPGASRFFGNFVAISGDHAIVGAKGLSAVYLFRRTAPDTWHRGTYLNAIMPTNVRTQDWFGSSVSISGTYAIASAPGMDAGTGSAYIFSSEIDDVLHELTPDAPANITLSAEDGRLTVDWGEVFDATGYNLYMTSEEGLTLKNYSSLSDGHMFTHVPKPFTVNGLINGTTYYFIVTALNHVGESVPSKVVSATPVSLAVLYFTGKGQISQEAILEKHRLIQEQILRAQNDLPQVNGDFAARQVIQDGLFFLNTDDGESANYGGTVKGRVRRLKEDIIPYWESEEAKSWIDADWNQFVQDELALQNGWLDLEKATVDFLNDQNLYYLSCDRGYCAIFITPGEIRSRRTGLLNQKIDLLQTEIILLDDSLGIFAPGELYETG